MCSRLRAEEREIKKEREKVSAFLEREKREREAREKTLKFVKKERKRKSRTLSLSLTVLHLEAGERHRPLC